MTAPTPGFSPRRAQMGRYTVWLSRDFVMNIAIISILLFGLLGMLSILQVRTMAETFAISSRGREFPLSAKIRIFMEIWGVFVTVGPIIAMSGMVSQDRAMGYTRFLFAKPLSVRWYYLQSLLVRFVGFMLVGILLAFLYSRFEPPNLSWRMVVDMLVCFAAFGGVVFLISVLSRFDGLVAIVFFLVSSVLWGVWRSKDGIRHAVTYLVPPVQQFGDLHQWVVNLNFRGEFGGVEFPTKFALWGAGYGLACIVLGLYLLRRIPLTKA